MDGPFCLEISHATPHAAVAMVAARAGLQGHDSVMCARTRQVRTAEPRLLEPCRKKARECETAHEPLLAGAAKQPKHRVGHGPLPVSEWPAHFAFSQRPCEATEQLASARATILAMHVHAMASHPQVGGSLPAAMPRLESKGSKLMRRTLQTRSPVGTKMTVPPQTYTRQNMFSGASRTGPYFAAPSAALTQTCVAAAASKHEMHTPGKDERWQGPSGAWPALQREGFMAEQPMPSASRGAPRRGRGAVRFGKIQVLEHEVELDDSKLPSDGAAPLGLGQLISTEHMSIDSYEERRVSQRRGTHMIPAEERRAALSAAACSSLLERVERENCALKHAMKDSLREHIISIVAAESDAEKAANSMGVQAVDRFFPVGVKLVRERRPRQVAYSAT